MIDTGGKVFKLGFRTDSAQICHYNRLTKVRKTSDETIPTSVLYTHQQERVIAFAQSTGCKHTTQEAIMIR